MAANEKLRRIAVVVIDPQTGKPRRGVPIAAELEFGINSGRLGRTPLALLATDHAGYVSFDVTLLDLASGTAAEITAKNSLEHVWILPYGDRTQAFDVLASASTLFDALVTRWSCTRPASGNGMAVTGARGVPSIQNPSITDWYISPASFSLAPILTVGENSCESIVPTNLATNEYRFGQVVRDIGSTTGLDVPTNEPNGVIGTASGALLEYRVTWRPIGHSLGQIAYSLPLAPSESVNIAVVDWSRRDIATRDEDLTIKEELLHNLHRDRSIDETVNASLYEHQYGGSIMGGAAGSFGEGIWSASGALGGAYTSSSGERDVAADTSQQLSDSFVQASTSLRRLSSTVVVQASQQESDVVQTRTVTNHNHCHALTVLYYEVVRNYRVSTEWVGKRPLVFVRYATPDFDVDTVVRYFPVLTSAVRDLDPSLIPCFDVMLKLYCANRNLNTALAASAALPLEGFTVQVPSPFTGGRLRITLQTRTGARVDCILPGVHSSDPGQLQDAENAWLTNPADLSVVPVTNTFSPSPAGLTWGDVTGIRIETSTVGTSGATAWPIAHTSAWTAYNGQIWLMYDGTLPGGRTQVEPDDLVILPVRPLPPADAMDLLSDDERCCVARLLDHLNTNKMFYLRNIWVREDPNRRGVRFDAIPFGAGSLLDAIDNRIIAVAGDYVAFPAGPRTVPTDGGNAVQVIAERLISIPARGVFAEAMLGHCNACEEEDVTRFWDWQKSPCPEKPPEIAPVATGSRAKDISVTPSTLPNPVVNIVNPPSAPDPTAMAGALTLLGTSNVFRDMSGITQVGELLQKLASGTISLQSAREQAEGLLGGTGGGGGGATGRSAGANGGAPSPEQQHDQLQVFRNAAAKGDITPAQQQDLAANYLQNASTLAATGRSGSAAWPTFPYDTIGIDVSAANGPLLDWARIAAARCQVDSSTALPVSFAYIKATHGTSGVDGEFSKNWPNCRADAPGILRGPYHWFTPGNGALQADHYWKTVSALGYLPTDLIPVIDVEQVADSAGWAAYADELDKCLQAVKTNFGRTPMIYTGHGFWNDASHKLVSDPRFLGYPLWMAYADAAFPPNAWSLAPGHTEAHPFKLTPPPAFSPKLPGGVVQIPSFATSWQMWQIRAIPAGEIDGIRTPVDLDVVPVGFDLTALTEAGPGDVAVEPAG